MAGEKRNPTESKGWTPQEKGVGTESAQPQGDAGAAGAADPKAKPTDDRAATETAAARIDREGGATRPGGSG